MRLLAPLVVEVVVEVVEEAKVAWTMCSRRQRQW